ncbi:MAG: hypothetical protein HY682_00070 [Chloroflexi bacterium]|nr:hypothetical protein [Chloroflexota bacterium]
MTAAYRTTSAAMWGDHLRRTVKLARRAAILFFALGTGLARDVVRIFAAGISRGASELARGRGQAPGPIVYRGFISSIDRLANAIAWGLARVGSGLNFLDLKITSFDASVIARA